MKKIITLIAAALLVGCHSRNNPSIQSKDGCTIIQYDEEGTVVICSDLVIVKKDSAYYMPQNGVTYHTMSVRLYKTNDIKDSTSWKKY